MQNKNNGFHHLHLVAFLLVMLELGSVSEKHKNHQILCSCNGNTNRQGAHDLSVFAPDP